MFEHKLKMNLHKKIYELLLLILLALWDLNIGSNSSSSSSSGKQRCHKVSAIELTASAYHDININIDPEVPKENCQATLIALENMLKQASTALHYALDERYAFGSFNIILPDSWSNACIPSLPSATSEQPYNSSINSQWQQQQQQQQQHEHKVSIASIGIASDLAIINSKANIFGTHMWTQQYGGCGMPGRKIFIPHSMLQLKERHVYMHKEFIKEWAKYRYGVFDEIGYTQDQMCYHNNGRLQVTGCTEKQEILYNIERICSAQNNTYDDFVRIIQVIVDSKSARASLMFAPQAASSTKYCSSKNHNRYAPTRQNNMCDRQATYDVIMRHTDFWLEGEKESESAVTLLPPQTLNNAQPLFNYQRRAHKIRYVVIIDDSLDASQRESWSYLRNAFRKWVLYDLTGNDIEIGVIQANGKAMDRYKDLTALSNATNRDLVASFLSYTPSDTRQMLCISCALEKAFNMFDEYERDGGESSTGNVILLIAPGMDAATDLKALTAKVKHRKGNKKVCMVTINYPDIIAPRQALSALSRALESDAVASTLSFSIFEQKLNSEKSYLNTYVQLTNAFMDIGRYYYESAASVASAASAADGGEHNSMMRLYGAIEIHRNEIHDSFNGSNNKATISTISTSTTFNRRSTRQASGSFYLEKNFVAPAGFYIYTHSTETPLIQSLRLWSPTGRLYVTRSDQRMPVKQITLLAALNETGYWHYEIERYPGNPQPHIVQVMATPRARHIKTHAWLVQRRAAQQQQQQLMLSIYYELKYGNYPVLNAKVYALVWQQYNNSNIPLTLELLDTGAGEPDIQQGDGIYSRHLKVTAAGIYTFDFYVQGQEGTTCTLSDDSEALKYTGSSSLPIMVLDEAQLRRTVEHTDSKNEQQWYHTKATGPFERYGPMLTHYITEAELQQNSQERAANAAKNTLTTTSNEHAAGGIADLLFLGRILDLKCMQQQGEGTILNFSWSLPDMGDLEAAAATVDDDAMKYELRYAPNLHDIIDNFDAQSELLNRYETTASSITANAGSASFVYNLTNHQAYYDKILYFAIRLAYQQHLDDSSFYGPISNVLEVYIPAKLAVTTTTEMPTAIYTTATSMESDASNNESGFIVKASPVGRYALLHYLIAAVVLILLLLMLLCLGCYMLRCRRARSNCGKQKSSQQQQQQSSKLTGAIATMPTAADASLITMNMLQQQQQQSKTDTLATSAKYLHNACDIDIGSGSGSGIHPDHHTVGIPIYDDDNICKQRLSFSGSQNYSIEDVALSNNSTAAFYNGISLISMNDACIQQQQQQQQRIFNLSHNWSGVLDNDNELGLATNGQYNSTSVPPVPPLPMPLLESSTAATAHYNQQHTQHYHHQQQQQQQLHQLQQAAQRHDYQQQQQQQINHFNSNSLAAPDYSSNLLQLTANNMEYTRQQTPPPPPPTYDSCNDHNHHQHSNTLNSTATNLDCYDMTTMIDNGSSTHDDALIYKQQTLAGNIYIQQQQQQQSPQQHILSALATSVDSNCISTADKRRRNITMV